VERVSQIGLASEDPWKLYEQAVEAAKFPQPSAISTSLVPIVHSTPGLRWDGQGRVLMATWTKGRFYDGKKQGDPYAFDFGQSWLTAVPFVKSFCQKVQKDKLTLRLQQLLGLPPKAEEDANDTFVEVWVNPADLFRPCADPEIIDRECTLNLTAQDSPEGQCPWKDSFAGQVSERWVKVEQTHLDWMCSNWEQVYPPDPLKGFPWTALGYTYDWGQPDHVGQSEFVAPKGTKVVIESITGTAEYCGGGPKSGTSR